MADQQRRGDLHRGLGPEGLGRKKKQGEKVIRLKLRERYPQQQLLLLTAHLQ